MNIDTRHRLLDLKAEVEEERDVWIEDARQTAKQAIADIRINLTSTLNSIKADYRGVYQTRKAKLINETGDE